MKYKESLEFQKFNEEEDDLNMLNKLIDKMGYSKYQFIITIIAATILAVDGAQSILLAILLSFLNQFKGLSEYDLALINTLESVGYTLATILVNIITQCLSNRRTVQLFSILSLLSTAMCLSTYNFYFICSNRFSFGFCMGCIDLLIYIILVENSPTKLRGFLSSFIFIFYPIGSLIISFFGYFQLKEQKNNSNFLLLVVIPFLFILFFTILVFFLQETPRTLITENKVEEGIKILQKINSFNDKDNEITNDQKDIIINEMKKKLEKKNTMTSLKFKKQLTINVKGIKADDLINSTEDFEKLSLCQKSKRIFNSDYKKYTLLIWGIVILCSFTLNGIFFMLPTTAPELTKDNFKEVLLSIFIEIPSNLFTSILIENSKIGRLWTIRIGLICSFVVSLMHFIYLKPILYIDCVLKFFINIPVSVITVYGSEIYDSKVRIFGTSTINFWKRLSIMTAPLTVAYFDGHFWKSSGYILFAPCVFFALILSFFLDIETRGVPLDEFIKLEN